MKKAAIIGAGEIGRAIGFLLESKGIKHYFYDINPTLSSGRMPEVLDDSEMIVFCVPSWGLRDALLSTRDFLKGDEIIVLLSKGLESTTGKSAPEIAADVLPRFKKVFLGGPLIAEEVMEGKSSIIIVASGDPDAAETVRAAFSSDNLPVIVSKHIKEIAFAAVLKNVYTILVGAMEGTDCGVNAKGAVMSASLFEMEKLMKAFGLRQNAVYSLAGFGDFIATASGPLSGNWSAGFAMVKNKKPEKSPEGVPSVIEICRKLGRRTRKFPILNMIKGLIEEEKKEVSIKTIAETFK